MRALTLVGFVLVLAAAGRAQVTQRVSVSSGGAQADALSALGLNGLSISADGRYVAFESDASTLVAGDTNGSQDVFVRDRVAGTTERVSVSSAGAQGDSGSSSPSMSADGRFVSFASLASNLVPGDTNADWDIFVRDRMTGTTERVSVDSGGLQGNGESTAPSISANGLVVSYESASSNLVAGDTNGRVDVFVHDRVAGTTERVSVSATGAEGNQASDEPAISGDGRYVVFDCWATNLWPGDTNGTEDLFLRDRLLGTLERLSESAGGVECNGETGQPKISADGRYVVFFSMASNLVPGDTNASADLFVRDRVLGTIERVSVDSAGAEADLGSIFAGISDDGRWVSFMSVATNLVPGDTNGASDVFLKDRQTGALERVSVSSGGAQGDLGSWVTRISADGRYVAFTSAATNLAAADTNGVQDVFVHDRDATGFKSLCDPGLSGVIACPCSNPPAGPGQGCDNSAATGGATLSASGVAYLSIDSLVFTTSAETPTAPSILLQGDALAGPGVVFGQGVRCADGGLKRLYVKIASGGSITAPDFGAGDPPVSVRSAALGDVILPGQSRWYLVYYRDPTVLGGCPASSTFNATPTGEVGPWWP